MIRSAVLVSGKGTKLQSLLDSVFFGEIPELQLVAVISSDANAYALKRARNAGIETVVFDRGGYVYHGRVQALAEGAREGGRQF